MKKFFLLLLVCLTLIISLLLKWQWHAYSTSSTTTITKEANQQIQIVAGSSKMDIQQTFSGLSPKVEYEILVPDNISKWTCQTKTGKKCNSIDQNPTTYQSEDGELKIVYSIPLDRKKNYSLLSNWKIRLKEVSIQHSSVTIAESFLRKGIWIVGLPLKGYKELDLIDFFSFAGEGDFESLYFQKTKLDYHLQELSYGYYSNAKPEKKWTFSQYPKLPKISFIVIVSSNEIEYENKDMIIVKKNHSPVEIDNRLVRQFFKRKLEFDSDAASEVFSSYLSNKEPANPETREIVSELKRELSKNELSDFYQKVINSPSSLDEKELDTILGEVKGLKTHFFQENLNIPSIPLLYFVESKFIQWNGEQDKKVDLLYMNSKRLYPVDQVLGLLGYQIDYKNNQIYVHKQSLSYQFNPSQNYFQLNGHEYGLFEVPFVKIKQHYYIDQNMLTALFKINIKEDGENILMDNQDL
ncbi:hypothetical protein [Neobacillus sp. D3-1R]|uniref:hypothetical protein n=1 Tax=Neobacillus sp. D3-1R TaxID=3445778 RepID=UPI003F9FA82F